MAMMAVVVLGLAGLAFGLYSMFSSPGATAPAAPSFQDMKISILMSRNDLATANLSGDGRYLAYVTRGDLTQSLVVRQVRTGSDVPIISDSEIPIRGIKFSPDGDYLYFLNRDADLPNYSSLYQVASLGGTPRKIAFDVDSASTFSPDGTQFCFRRGLIDLNADSLVIAHLETGDEKELVRILYPSRYQGAPAWSPDGKVIAVAIQTTEGGARTYVAIIDAESGESTPLGEDIWLDINSLGWTPDGNAILVSAFKLGAGTAPQIRRIAYPGGQAVRMTNDLDGYTNISVSTDGTTIAAVRQSAVTNVWVARTDGTADAAAITFASGTATSIGEIAPLPGGATAFTAPHDNKLFIWRMEADGSQRRQLTSQGLFTFNPFWTDKSGLIFNRLDADQETIAHIWRINPDGSGMTQLTEGTGEQIRTVSPAGNAMVFQKWDEPQALWISRMDGSDPVKISGTLGGIVGFSPDGQRILITRLEGDEGRMFPHRYILPVEGGAPLGHFLLPPGATNIRWVPDGTAITYVDRGQGWNIMRKSLPDGEPEQITSFTTGRVFNHRWHLDGSRLAIHRKVGRNSSLWEMHAGADPKLITEFKTGDIRGLRWAPDEPLLYFTYGTSSQDVVLITDFR
jgi:Tol biopolymer transport system component